MQYTALLSLMAPMATSLRSDLPIMPMKACFLQHSAREAIHARGVVGAGRADRFVAHGVDRADVVNETIGEIDGQPFALGDHVGQAFVRGVATGEDPAVEQQQRFARFPVAMSALVMPSRFTRREDLKSSASLGQSSSEGGSKPGPEPSSVKCTWRVAAQLGNSATGLTPRAWVLAYLHVQHGRKVHRAPERRCPAH